MTEKFLLEIKKKLEEKKKQLEEELKGFAKKDPNMKGDWDTNYPSFEKSASNNLEEGADEVEEYANLLPVEHSLELSLVEVDKAIERIKRKKYGICEKCRKNISLERLKISPEATTCIECKK